ncbi:MAG: FAD-dependent monooxygenase, partial [Pseudonocardia sp.]|nr:FAD-dependent monooxygenase [Pseudonocardia sp.]
VEVDLRGDEPGVTFTADGRREQRSSDWVAGADGGAGVSAAAVPPQARRIFTHDQQLAWVSILAAVPPSAPHIVYAPHRRGFAGHMLRTPFHDAAPQNAAPQNAAPQNPMTRFYLQAPRDTTIEQWPESRVWDELHQRLATPDPTWRLRTGPIVESSVLRMRSVVTEPMQHARLLLLGDAAHIITPVGAKGMNLAIHDAEVAADALTTWASGDESGVDTYSTRCLARVWRHQGFSHHLTRLLHPVADPFQERLRAAALEHLLGSEHDLTAFARAYVGVN